MIDGDKPYQIPLNYGYKDNSLYIHSARGGKKIDLLRANNLVHFQIETRVEVKNLLDVLTQFDILEFCRLE